MSIRSVVNSWTVRLHTIGCDIVTRDTATRAGIKETDGAYR